MTTDNIQLYAMGDYKASLVTPEMVEAYEDSRRKNPDSREAHIAAAISVQPDGSLPPPDGYFCGKAGRP